MNLTFENQGTNTYLVYQLQETDEVDTLSLGMLTNNKIPGLAPVMYTQMDNAKYIKYNVSAKVPVQQLFSRAVNKKRLLGVFNGIVNAMLSAEEYMIDTNTILVDLNYMFTDVTTCETILVSLPIDSVVKTSALSDLGTLFKNIVFSTQFDQTENCDYVAKLINYLNSTPVFTLNNFKEVLDSLDNPMMAQQQMAPAQPVMQPQQPMGVPAQPMQPVVQPAPMATPVAPAPQPVPQPVQTPQMPNVPAVPPAPQKGKKNANVAVPPTPQAAPAPANPDEKSMSMFSLLCHYNKENAQLYKEQKARKKEQAAIAKQQGAAPAVPGAQAPTPAKGNAKAPANNMGFAIPGMPDAPVSAPASQPAVPTPQPKAVPQPVVPQPTPIAQPAIPQPTPVAQPVMPQAVATPAPQPAMQPMPQTPVMPAQPMGGSANFGETTVLGMGGGGIGETTVLGMTSMAMELKPFLIRMKNNERIPVDKPVFRIGKEKSYVDYFISDNTAISRSHANIVARDGEYYLVDTNSTNHTYVNNSMIQSNVETKLTTGTKIRFANEEFEFILA